MNPEFRPEENCTDFGDLLQPIAILDDRSEPHSAEEVEPIRETCAFTARTWQHDCTSSHQALRIFASSPGSRRSLHRPAAIYRVSSELDFTVANGEQFYKLRAAILALELSGTLLSARCCITNDSQLRRPCKQIRRNGGR